MIITWSKHAGKTDPDGEGAITYMTAASVTKSLDGKARRRETRNPLPRILRGSPDLVGAMITSIPFKCRYSSGVLSFEAGDIDLALFHASDPALMTQLRRVMVEFEEVAFAGVPAHQRPPILWTSHSHTGRLELNFLIPRAVYVAAKVTVPRVGVAAVARLGAGPDMVIKSYNPHPPGDEARKLMDGFRNRCNSKFGWADPMDPARRRALAIPDHELKLARNAARLGAPVIKASDREQLHEAVCGWIREGQVNDRPELEEKLRRAGYEIVRDGEDYLSVRSLRDHPKGLPRLPKSMRMKGGIWSRAFRSRDYAMALIDDATRQEFADQSSKRKAFDDDEYQLCLKRRRKFNMQRYPYIPLREDKKLSPLVEITPDVTGPIAERLDRMIGMIAFISSGDAEDLGTRTTTKLRLLRSLYPIDVPRSVSEHIRYVNVDERRVWFDDGSVVTDKGDAIECTKTSEAAVQLMALEAAAKGWKAGMIEGPDDFLIMLALACGKLGIRVVGSSLRSEKVVDEALLAAGFPLWEAPEEHQSAVHQDTTTRDMSQSPPSAREASERDPDLTDPLENDRHVDEDQDHAPGWPSI